MDKSAEDALSLSWGQFLLKFTQAFSTFVGVTNRTGIECPPGLKLDKNKPYVMTMCPHGAFAWTAMFHGPQMSL